MSRAHIAICMPSDDTWKAPTATSVIDMIRFSMANGVDCGVINWRGAMVTASRNGLVKLATDIKGVDAILWIDSDMVIPPDALLRLLDHDKDIVGCFYNKRVPPHETVGKLKDPDADITKGGLHEADYLPGGFVMVKAGVYAKMTFPYYFETYRWPGNAIESFLAKLQDEAIVQPVQQDIAALASDMRFLNWLERNHAADIALHPNPTMSEDYSFCKKARRLGYKLWCDVSLTTQVAHLGLLPVTCVLPTN